MEIGLRVKAEHPFSGETRHIVSAYFTFVALVRVFMYLLPSPPTVSPFARAHTHIHKYMHKYIHTHIYIYIYLYVDS